MIFQLEKGSWWVNRTGEKSWKKIKAAGDGIWKKIPLTCTDYLEDIGFCFDQRHDVPPIKRERPFVEAR